MMSALKGGGSQRALCTGTSHQFQSINQFQMHTKGRGSEYPEILRTSYIDVSLGNFAKVMIDHIVEKFGDCGNCGCMATPQEKTNAISYFC